MKIKKIAKSFVRVLTICAMFLSLLSGTAIVGHAESPVEISDSSVRLMENCTADISGDTLVVTDLDDNNDVWSSKLLLDAGLELTPGEEYKLSFALSGDNGVGEFFLCKSENLDDRYDETFASEAGDRSITFTAAGNRAYFGMQVGNLGKGNSVTATVSSLGLLSESACPALLRTENCSVDISGSTIVATDIGDNNDVWNSKLLYDAGAELEIGKTYTLSVELFGDKGVGEFFLCRSRDLNDRYDDTFTNAAGARSLRFTAESDKLYIGMQFGNIGNGSTVTAVIGEPGESAGAAPSAGSWSEAPAAAGGSNAVNCSYTVNGNVITVTDLGGSDDVWDSRLLYDAGIQLEVGKKYEIHFTLSGDNGVGEFFLCKSMDINDRYDESFTNASGERTVVFTAESERLYIGMQVGNVGSGNSVTATVGEVKEYDESAQSDPKVIIAENCDYQIDNAGEQTVITVVDTEDNNDVWNSKLLYFLGDILEKDKFYAAAFSLIGENGVGEFFFCKTDDLNNRYSFDNTAGDHVAKFTAEDCALYVGMQFGNIGSGSELEAIIQGIFRIPGMQKSSESCSEAFSQDAITITDTSDENDVWTSKAVYDTGIVLEPGKTYTVTFTLSGDNGVGEFFFLKSDNIDDRYSFDNVSGTHTITFTAESAALFFGVQCGNLGNGNSVTVSNISVSASPEEGTDSEPAAETAALSPEEPQGETLTEPAAEETPETETEPDAETAPETEEAPDAGEDAATEKGGE
ncbi:MAG: hypothetical protein IKH34_00270 [Oscillospiraceae bacterium]|nr:hypothetical protein [Oscillospiraceae bacterium]